MQSGLWALIAVIMPLAGAFLLPLAGLASVRLRNLLALVFVLGSLAASIALVPGALAGQTASFLLNGPLGLSFHLEADALAVFMALVSSLVGAIIILFSFDYISHYENQDEYYLMAVLFLGAMMGLVFSANLIFLYVFWEITGIASWRLIGFYRSKTDVLRADKAFLVTAFGALVMLLGILAVNGQTGTFDLDQLKGRALPWAISALLLVGMLSKSATLPFHTWLPDAGVAPSPVTALLHAAVLVKIGVYVFARLFLATFALDESMRTAVAIIAAASALVSAGAALVDTDFKRIVAYSTVSQIGFIFLGLATGSALGALGRSCTSSCTASPRPGFSSQRASSSRTRAPRTSRSWAGFSARCPSPPWRSSSARSPSWGSRRWAASSASTWWSPPPSAPGRLPPARCSWSGRCSRSCTFSACSAACSLARPGGSWPRKAPR